MDLSPAVPSPRASTPASTQRPRLSRRERGAALLVVTFVMIVVLVGGLGAISLVNSELTGVRGPRVRSATEACAEAAVERLRAMLPNEPTFDETEGTMQLGSDGVTLTYRAGHVDGDGEKTIVEVDPQHFDMSSLYKGLNLTNTMGTVTGDSLAEGLRILRLTAVCEGDTYGKREVQVVLRYGTPTN